MYSPDGSIDELSISAEQICSSFTAELVAIHEAIKYVIDAVGICIFSDCKIPI